MRNYFLLALVLVLLSSCSSKIKKGQESNLLSELDVQYEYFAEQTDVPEKVARSFSAENGYRWASIKDWTCGFPPGSMWLMYELTGDEKWKINAAKFTAKLEGVQFRTTTHDLGFMVYCSFGNGFLLTGEEKYKKAIIDGSNSLITRFNEKTSCIKSWDHGDWQFPVIIDNMMNLEMLLKASELTGDPKYKEVAIAHTNTTIENHFRENMSSYHVIDYDTITGKAINKQTHQGLNDESSWGRGQAWGLYGFTVMYRGTGDSKYLDVATKIADFIIPNLPEDKVSYWDFDDPQIPNTYRDVSAAAITASALLELGGKEMANNESYIEIANQIIESLNSDKYRAKTGTNGGFLLMHSVGHMPKNSEIDVPINYADYYYLEALKRQGNF